MAHAQQVVDEPEVLTVEELAVILRRSRASIYRDIAAGTFPLQPIRLGSHMRFSRVRVNAFLHGE